MITALDLLFARRGHAVVAQVIETEFAVRAVSDVAGVLLPAHLRFLIVLNAADRQSEKIVKRAHPLGVAPSQVIVHRDQMRAASGERAEIKGQRCDQSFSFTGRHFPNSTAM